VLQGVELDREELQQRLRDVDRLATVQTEEGSGGGVGGVGIGGVDYAAKKAKLVAGVRELEGACRAMEETMQLKLAELEQAAASDSGLSKGARGSHSVSAVEGRVHQTRPAGGAPSPGLSNVPVQQLLYELHDPRLLKDCWHTVVSAVPFQRGTPIFFEARLPHARALLADAVVGVGLVALEDAEIGAVSAGSEGHLCCLPRACEALGLVFLTGSQVHREPPPPDEFEAECRGGGEDHHASPSPSLPTQLPWALVTPLACV
jgi:hypothetical protein